VSETFRNILVAADRYRSDTYTRQNAVILAERLRASLRMVYIVDLEDLKVLAPGAPEGMITRRVLRGSGRESKLVAEGRKEGEKLATICKGASIECSSDVFVGRSRFIWSEKARSSDLFMILPIERDFGPFELIFGSMFWWIAACSCRPVLMVRQDGLRESRIALFYSNEVQSARALPWVCGLCSTVGMSLSVYAVKPLSRKRARDEECQIFFDRHRVPARFEDRNALVLLDAEVNQPGTQLHEPSLLVFDRGFYSGPCFRKRRRLVERLIRTSHHSILLCP